MRHTCVDGVPVQLHCNGNACMVLGTQLHNVCRRCLAFCADYIVYLGKMHYGIFSYSC